MVLWAGAAVLLVSTLALSVLFKFPEESWPASFRRGFLVVAGAMMRALPLSLVRSIISTAVAR